MTPVVADTGVLVAAISPRDRDHSRCKAAIERHRRVGVVVPSTVAAEVDYLARSRISRHAALAFLEDIEAGRYIWEPVTASALTRAADIDRQYPDLDLGLVDGSVVAVAESLKAETILTLDQGHFSACAPDFTLEP